jgi:hypothetical protein
MPILYYIIAWPFIVIGTVAEFIISDIISGSRWKQRQQPPSNIARIRLEETIAARRQLRETEYMLRRQLAEAENKFREELKRKEREIGYLRSCIR